MKKLALLTLFIMSIMFFNSGPAYCKSTDNSDVTPMYVVYCPNSINGYHGAGMAESSNNWFFDESVFPTAKKYVEGCPPGYNLYVCKYCRAQIYYDPQNDKYIDYYSVHYLQSGILYYACVHPSKIFPGHLGWQFLDF